MATAGGGDLSDEERRAMRGSKFAPLPPPPSTSRPQPRMAHPGGPLTTNKAAALAKFLERKLQQPDGLDSLNPDLVKLAVKNAKETMKASKGEASTSGRVVRHVSSFEDGSEQQDSEDEAEVKGIKRKRKNKKVKAHQDDEQQSKKKKKKKNKKKKGKGC
ncbi:NKAP family protein CG6066 isoform X1 [Setaria italica]|uniref:NKAP family protein CG6066 isoform X1 n=1 Tax=Setaria italica TaxID=4555 RepID=UPI000BE5BD83|nr:NKAP family protein CG6066 isoform X1 [Setaria italica]